MTTPPALTMHVAPAATEAPGVLVVHEGSRRLRWHTSSPDRWELVGLWPERGDVDSLLARIHRDEPVLVVLPGHDVRVDVMDHEIAMPLDGFAHVSPDRGITELTLPLLEWLPEPLRSRGLLFADQATAALAGRPRGLRAPLLVERLHEGCALRFAQRTRTAITDAAFADAACQVFADRFGPHDPTPRTALLANPLTGRSAS